MMNFPLPRLDAHPEVRERLLSFCRLKAGEVWTDPVRGHKVGCLDASKMDDVGLLMSGRLAQLALQDPPYNLAAFQTRTVSEYVRWCRDWVDATNASLAADSSLYVWMGADQKQGFQPLPDFMIMMRGTAFAPRSLITMRNQRGYGTQSNWMCVRQELLYYVKGCPSFHVDAEYTEIPKILRGYYKKVSGELTENLQRSNSDCIRAGNVWVDVQQVFYRMQENVNGCYAQKPLKSSERILLASSDKEGLVVDFFGHSGTTLLSAEINDRVCYTIDTEPVFCEIMIRRLEHYRQTGMTGWQNSNPFEIELGDAHLRDEPWPTRPLLFGNPS